MARKPRIEMILEAVTKDGKIIRDMAQEERFALHYPDQKIMLHYRPYGDMAQKERMFNFIHGPLLQCLANELHDRGFEGSENDFFKAMKSRYASKPWLNPLTGKEETVTLDFSSDSTTSGQLCEFLNNIVLFIEKDLGAEAPSSDEWKVQKRLGSSKRTFQ